MSDLDKLLGSAHDNEDQTTTTDDTSQIQVLFKPSSSARHLPRAPDNVFAVPASLGRYGLSELLNHILELKPSRTFEFLINGKFLRVTLEKYLTSHNLTSEETYTLEYVEATPPPERDESVPHPDWVSSLDSSLGVSSVMLPTNHLKQRQAETADDLKKLEYAKQNAILSVAGCYDHLVRVWAHSLDNEQDAEPSQFDDAASKIWKKSTYSLVAQGIGHRGPVTSVRVARPFISSDDASSKLALVVSGSHDKTARLWELTAPETNDKKAVQAAKKLKCTGVFDYHIGSVTSVETFYHPNRPNSLYDAQTQGGTLGHASATFFTAGYDGAVALWSNSRDYIIDQEIVDEHRALVNKGMGQRLKAQKTYAEQSAARTSSLDDEQVIPHYKPMNAYIGHKGAVSCITAPSRTNFYSAGYDTTIKLWDLDRSTPLHAWSGGHVVNSIDYNHDLNMIASGDQDGYVRLWDPRVPTTSVADQDGPLRTVTTTTNKGQFRACDSWVSSVSWAPSIIGQTYYLFTTGYDGQCKLWDIRSSKPLYTVDTSSQRLLAGTVVPTTQPRDGQLVVPVYTLAGGTGKQIDRLRWNLNISL